MEILSVCYSRYVKDWLQLLDLHKFALLGKTWPNMAKAIVGLHALWVPNVLQLVAADSDFHFAFVQRFIDYIMQVFECANTYFAGFVRIYSRTLFPFAVLQAVGVDSPYLATEL